MTLILSDLHLGLPSAPSPPDLSSLLDEAQEVVLNGDSAESSSRRFGTRGEDALSDLRGMLSRAGSAFVRLDW